MERLVQLFLACREQGGDISQARMLGHLARSFTIVNSRAQVGIGSALEENLDDVAMAFSNCHVERGVIVDPTERRIGAKLEEQCHDLRNVLPSRGARLRARTRQCSDERGKAVVVRQVRIGANLEQRSNERQRAVIDGVHETRADGEWHRSVRNTVGVVHGGAKRSQISSTEGLVNPPKRTRVRTPFFFGCHGSFARAKAGTRFSGA
jgi:hypothetical protein